MSLSGARADRAADPVNSTRRGASSASIRAVVVDQQIDRATARRMHAHVLGWADAGEIAASADDRQARVALREQRHRRDVLLDEVRAHRCRVFREHRCDSLSPIVYNLGNAFALVNEARPMAPALGDDLPVDVALPHDRAKGLMPRVAEHPAEVQAMPLQHCFVACHVASSVTDVGLSTPASYVDVVCSFLS